MIAKYKKTYKNGKMVYRVRKKLPNGKTANIFGTTIAEVEEKLAKLNAEFKATHAKDVPTVEEYVEGWLKRKAGTVKSSTMVGYACKSHKYIIAPLGEKLICDVTSDDILGALSDLSTRSESFCHDLRMLIKNIFDDAEEAGHITKNPTRTLTPKKFHGCAPVKNNQRKKALTDEQVNILLAAVEGLPVETFVRIGLGAGLRREETLALTWDDILIDDPTPRIKVCKAWRLDHNRPLIESTLKTEAAEREIPIDSELTAFLREKRAASNSVYVVANADGDPLSGSQWRNLWKQVTTRSTLSHSYKRKENGTWVDHVVTPVLGEAAKNNPGVIYSIPFHVTSHMLRHTYISRLILAGVNPKTVQVVVGHANSKMTMDVYAELTENRPEQIADQIFSKVNK